MPRGLREERGGGMGGFGIDRYIIVFSRFSIYIRVCGENNEESCPTQSKTYLPSICLQIHTDYLTFLFEKKKKEKIFAKRM